MELKVGIQKAVVAFIMAVIALGNTAFALNWNVEENMVVMGVGALIAVGTAFGVWKVTNTVSGE